MKPSFFRRISRTLDVGRDPDPREQLHRVRLAAADRKSGMIMSNDLTFITNEPGKTLRERFFTLLGGNTKAIDCLVGYFYVSGFYRLYPALEKTEKIRILIGLKTDRTTFDLIQRGKLESSDPALSHAQIRDSAPADVLAELQDAEDNASVEAGIRKFIEWVRSGKLEIKVYPSEKIHAKVYVMTFVDGAIDKGRVITGSSNLSQSGLQDNLEFNVELKDRSDYEFALAKFNELWENAVEVSKDYVDAIESESPYATFTPHEMYLKFLYEYFKRELGAQESGASIYQPVNFKRLRYQNDAVTSAKRILDEYGGVFISDVVGLGKTYMAAMLARQLEGRHLVIAPPALLDEGNPGSWPNVFRQFQIPQSRFQSIGKLDDLIRREVDDYENVFIDEAHRFRTESNFTYETLAQVSRGKRVILVTATPLNNSPKDILSQLKLFQKGKNSTIPNLRNLETFFNGLEKRLKGLDRQADKERYFAIVGENAREVREKILKYLMIRRTRSEISRFYAVDLNAQGIKFPEVADPEAVFYEFNDRENTAFDTTIQKLTKEFTFARYSPLKYYTGKGRDNEQRAQINLARFMRVLLVKRLESSFYAFKLTLGRFIESYQRFVSEYEKGYVYISKDYAHKIFEYLADDNVEAVERLLDSEKAERIPKSEFNSAFLPDLKQDLKTLRQLDALWSGVDTDPKWGRFKALLRTNRHLKREKLIIFTESQETARYLHERLTRELKERAILFSGSSDQATREEVIENFDAKVLRKKDDYRILVTTEVLSEGVNLHRSNVVLNYDIPWNPTRLIQRVGRVNRIDTQFDVVHTFNFFPTEKSNNVIKLREAAEAKIQAFIEMLGADARLLTDGEEIKSHDLFRKLTSKKTITGEDEDEQSQLEYLKEIREVREAMPELFARIKRLPKKARSSRLDKRAESALLTYFRRGALEKFFLSKAGQANPTEVDFFHAADILKCPPNQVRGPLGSDFYPLLEKNKEEFVIATTEELIAPSRQGQSDSGAKILKKLRAKEIRRFSGFTDEDEAYLEAVMRLLEEGALPKQTLKTVYASIKSEANPLKIVGILRRDISNRFFRATVAESGSAVQSTREVVLSEYLMPEGHVG